MNPASVHPASEDPAPDRPCARDDLETAVCDDELLVFDRLALTLHRLNATAALVLTHLDGVTDPAELVADLAAIFEADPDLVRTDVDAVIEQFRHDHLLVGTAPPPAPSRDRDLVPTPDPAPRRLLAAAARHPWAVRAGPFRAGRDRFWVACDDPDVGQYLASVLAPLLDAVPEPVLDPVSAPVPDPAPASRESEVPGAPREGDRWYWLRAPRGTHTRWRVHFDARRLGCHDDARHAVETVLFHVNRLATRPGPHTVFHAAAAAYAGAGLLLPARMDSGKSTTVAALVQDGFAYLSDEAVALTDDGLLWPFPKAVGLDPGSFGLFPELAPPADSLAAELQAARWQVVPDRLSDRWRTGPVPLAHVVSPQYRAGAETHLEPLSVADTLVLLLEQTFTLVDRPGALQDLADRLEVVPRHRLVIGDLTAARRLIAALAGITVGDR